MFLKLETETCTPLSLTNVSRCICLFNNSLWFNSIHVNLFYKTNKSKHYTGEQFTGLRQRVTSSECKKHMYVVLGREPTSDMNTAVTEALYSDTTIYIQFTYLFSVSTEFLSALVI